MHAASLFCLLGAAVAPALACGDSDSCYGPQNDVIMTRNVRRQQPDAQNATTQPKAPLEWGQVNFLHTTDTHGWLSGHVKEQNYGGDWGDYVSFVLHMREKARALSVDLLVVDTGDLHDGNGLGDATKPNGVVTNRLFRNIDYDLLTIGNHELYVSEVAYQTFLIQSKAYGERYLTSNVEILNPATGKFEYIGAKYRYFTTEQGLRIMAFGVLFDFTGNSNASRVTKGTDMVKQQWFLDALKQQEPIDLFVVLGHNPARPTQSSSTFDTVFSAIRSARPDIPVQLFGGHTHKRDFAVYDDKATAIESGRYCETLGWVSVSGVNSTSHKGNVQPNGVPNPSRPAVVGGKPNGTVKAYYSSPKARLPSLVYSRRYLDWNRLTFAYHAVGSQDGFGSGFGQHVSKQITQYRKDLNLSTSLGCVPETYCVSCKPFGAPGNIFSVIESALSLTVVNQSRAETARLIVANTGHIRFDLVKGPFSRDDSYIVSPFLNKFVYIPNVPYSIASKVKGTLNNSTMVQKRDGHDDWKPQRPTSHRDDRDRSGERKNTDPIYVIPVGHKRDVSSSSLQSRSAEVCRDPAVTYDHLGKRSYAGGRAIRRQSTELVPGYVTSDDFGTDGDDTPHSPIPAFPQPDYLQARGAFPGDGRDPETVDVIFLDFVQPNVLRALKASGKEYSKDDVLLYMPSEFTSNSYLPAYVESAWKTEDGVCLVGPAKSPATALAT